MSKKKRFSDQQKQENISRHQFREFLEQYGFVTSDISPDLGEDFLVRIYDDEADTGISFYVQLKSTTNIHTHTLETGDASYSCKVKDITHWDGQVIPVIFILWDVQRKGGMWIDMKSVVNYLNRNNSKWKKNKSVNIRILKDNILSKKGLKDIRRLTADYFYPSVSKGKSLVLTANFDFSGTTEGIMKSKEFESHMKTGEEVVIDGKYIRALDFSDWFTNLYGKFDHPGSLKLGIAKSKVIYPAKLTFTSEAGSETIPYMEFTVIKRGTEEVTISNEKKNYPLKIAIAINKTEGLGSLNIGGKIFNINCTKALEILKIMRIMSYGGTFCYHSLDLEKEFYGKIPSGIIPSPFPEEISFLENICYIQKQLDIELNIPDHWRINEKEYLEAEELVSLIKTGSYKINNVNMGMKFRKSTIIEILKYTTEEEKPEEMICRFDNANMDIFKNKIVLGAGQRRIFGYWKLPKEEIAQWLNLAKDEELLEIRVEKAELEDIFEKWIK